MDRLEEPSRLLCLIFDRVDSAVLYDNEMRDNQGCGDSILTQEQSRTTHVVFLSLCVFVTYCRISKVEARRHFIVSPWGSILWGPGQRPAIVRIYPELRREIDTSETALAIGTSIVGESPCLQPSPPPTAATSSREYHPSINHRHGPQLQEIRLGCNRSFKEGFCCMDPLDAPVVKLYQVDFNFESLGRIERDLAVGLEARPNCPQC